LGYSKYLVKSVYLEGLLGYLFGLLQYLRERFRFSISIIF